MRTYNPNKRIRIEIIQALNPAEGYEIWEYRKKCITRKASEDDIFDMLSENDYRLFQQGVKYTFSVSAQQLTGKFSFMYA